MVAVITTITASAPVISCKYSTHATYGYQCTMTLTNVDGFDNFTRIDGTHLQGKGNDDVRFVLRTTDSNTTNFPSIICDTFKSTTRINFDSVGMEKIGESSFMNCENLQDLYLNLNKINDIAENTFERQTNLIFLQLTSNQLTSLNPKWFENLLKLETVFLRKNQLADLPRNVFKPLSNLRSLWLNNNNLPQIHSDSFGFHPNFTTFYFQLNNLTGFDENLIENTVLTFINGQSNLCINSTLNDTTSDRSKIRAALQQCFDDYIL